MARASKFLGALNWKLNLMLPSTISAVSTVLVKSSQWSGSSEYVQVFPDQRCLDNSSTYSLRRNRLTNAASLGMVKECGEGPSHEVMRCDVV